MIGGIELRCPLVDPPGGECCGGCFVNLWSWMLREMRAVDEWRSGDEIEYFEVFETT